MRAATWLMVLGLLGASEGADAGTPSPGAPEAAVLEGIRQRYRATIERQRRFLQREVEVQGCGGEGAKLVAFLDGRRVRMLVLTRYGELGRLEREVHFFDGRVDFVYERALHYEGPLGKTTSVDEDRFYFSKGRLHLWTTGPSKRPVPPAKLGAHEAKLLTQAYAALAAVRAGSVRCAAVLE